MKEVARDFFGEKARERDFATDHDKLIYRNLPRFMSQRDYNNIPRKLFVPNQ